MKELVYSIFGLAVLGLLVDVMVSNKDSIINFVYDLIVLVVIVENLFKVLTYYKFI